MTRRELVRDLGRIDARGPQPLDVVDLDRGDVGERQHPPGRALPGDLGDADTGIRREVLGEPLGVLRLVEVVDLLHARVRELLDEPGQVDVIRDDLHAVEPAGHLAQRGEVDVDDLVDPRPLDLDDDVGEPGVRGDIGRESRPMRLTEGCRSHRHRIDRGERALERQAELCLGEHSDGREVDGRDFVLESLELFRDLGREHVEARRHELADLDHEAAERQREGMEVAGDPRQPRRAAARGEPARARCAGG